MNYRDLYKTRINSLNTSAKLKRVETLNQNRQTNRNNLFLNGRGLTIENFDNDKKKQGNSKRDAYIARFLAWKAEKKNLLEESKMKRNKPFISTVKCSTKSAPFKFPTPKKVNKKIPEKIKVKNNFAKYKKPQKEEKVEFRKPLVFVELNNRKEPKKSPKKRDEKISQRKLPLKTQQTTASVNVVKKRTTKNSNKLKIILTEDENTIDGFSKCVTSTAIKSSNQNITGLKLLEEMISPIENCTEENTALNKNKTPPPPLPQENKKEQINYLSPFVTTSRGKVSAKKEREKRESMYKLDISYSSDSVENRRKKESIKYFRKILNDEISNLHSQCDFWEEYKNYNKDKVEENGVDMINVTIGQTKLLVNSKLEQFRKLIDRCEKGIKIKSGELSDDEKPILAEDLEGFWFMVKLQIENVDKRFKNLECWKKNDWNDPEEEKPKEKNNLHTKNKITKTKIRKHKVFNPNVQLMALIKRAQIELNKDKGENGNLNSDVIFVTGKRKSERKSLSKTPNQCIGKDIKIKTPLSSRRKSLREKISSTNERKSLGEQSPLILRKKSILKTPGTIKKENQRVIFNDKLDFNSPKNMSGVEFLSDVDDDTRRSLHLRSRKIIMRDDVEVP